MVTSGAHAQAYPSKPVRFIVPFAAGGSADIVARVIAPKLGEQLSQQIVVDNRPGASAIIGVEAGAKAAPDGYTVTLGGFSKRAPVVLPALQALLENEKASIRLRGAAAEGLGRLGRAARAAAPAMRAFAKLPAYRELRPTNG